MTLLVAGIAALIGTVAVARAVRLLTSDAYPPAQALRVWWWNQTAGKGGWRTGWALLLTDPEEAGGNGCPFCAAPYAAAADLVWAVLARHGLLTGSGFWGVAWWLVNGWAAVSYVAAMIVVRDEPLEE